MIRYGIIATAGGAFAHYILNFSEKSAQVRALY